MGFALKTEYLPEYTIADWEQWEGQWELINGVPYAMSPAPTTGHQKINYSLMKLIEAAFSNCGKCNVFMPINLRLSNDTVLIPDITLFCEEISEELYIDKIPSLVVEIISPSTAYKDNTVKFELYEFNGIKYYILVEPKTKNIKIYELQNGSYKIVFEAGSGKFHFDLSECSATVNFNSIW